MIREQLHALTHRVPGVPGHDGGRNVRSRRRHEIHGHQGSATHARHHAAAEPRVLVGLQRWIASLAPRRGGRA
jgi:hypothetical protein